MCVLARQHVSMVNPAGGSVHADIAGGGACLVLLLAGSCIGPSRAASPAACMPALLGGTCFQSVSKTVNAYATVSSHC